MTHKRSANAPRTCPKFVVSTANSVKTCFIQGVDNHWPCWDLNNGVVWRLSQRAPPHAQAPTRPAQTMGEGGRNYQKHTIFNGMAYSNLPINLTQTNDLVNATFLNLSN